MKQLIAYFANRHLVTNFIAIGIILGGVFAWRTTNKEELPDITFDTVRISVSYPGAPAEDVEYFVTEPIERLVRGLDGVYRVTSTSGSGRSRINVELQQDLPNRNEVITEIRNTVLNVSLPQEVIDDPEIRIFQTSKKAILDVAILHRDERILSVEGRRELQRYAFALENRLLTLPEVNLIERRSYLREEIHIKADPDRLRRYEIPFNTVMSEIRASHVRRPAGLIESDQEPKVTLMSELNTPEKLRDLSIQGGFEGRLVKLGDVAEIQPRYEKNESILKVNGHEAVILNVVKNSGSGILVALDAVTNVVNQFKENNLKDTPIEIVFLDDESIDVRNRLDIIRNNGAIGFVLIVATLFIFLNKRSGFWVAFGIPFSFCFTMIGAKFLGYTINGTTLAAVIIVMGMVVDDAIVVAENITRLSHQGLSQWEAVVQGTSYVLLPVTAAIATTCVAFLPLFFFSGRHGAMIEFIPPIIFLMLGASLFESIFILPGHMHLDLPFNKRNNVQKPPAGTDLTGHWFDKVEASFGRALARILNYRWAVLLSFAVLFAVSGWIIAAKMKFVMFPDEETRDVTITGEVRAGATRLETARLVEPIEDALTPYINHEVVGFRTQIAQSRRGGAVQENRFRISVEIVPPEKRDKSADELIKEFKASVEKLDGFKNVKFLKQRWGQESGSPIEILVQMNNDKLRAELCRALADEMKADTALKNVEIDEGLRTPEYRIDLDREKVKRLSISPADITSTFRAALEGNILYEFSNGDEEVYVRFTTPDDVKKDIEKVLDLPVENRGNYLVPLRSIVRIDKTVSPIAIDRQDLKRTSRVYSEIEKSAKKTPLDIAERLEAEVFPKLLNQYPTAALSFGGEVQDTRESQSDLTNAVIMVLVLVYFILAVLFNSLTTPLIIMLSIPFGVIGIILAFYLHGKFLFGFYAAVGALGLAGVVINDSIVLLVKLRDDFKPGGSRQEMYRRIGEILQTRLRAVILTTLTTVVGLLPTAYGFGGYDAMLADMMLALSWGLVFGTVITLVLIPCVYSFEQDLRALFAKFLSGHRPMLIFLVFIPALFFSSVGAAQEPKVSTAATRTLSLDEFIRLATERDTEFQEILIDRLFLTYEKTLRLPPRDVVLSVLSQYNFFQDVDRGGAETAVGLAKLFPMTGTRVSAAYGVTPLALGGPKQADVSVTLSQSIAENAFGRSTRLLNRIVGLEVEIARYQIVEAYEDYLATLIAAYYNWYEAYESLQIGRAAYQSNLRLLENMKSRQKSRIALPIDVNKVQLQALAKNETVISLTEQYRSRLNVVERAIREDLGNAVRPVSPPLPDIPADYLSTWQEKFQKDSRTDQVLDMLSARSRLNVEREAQDLLPSLDLVVGFQTEGEGAGLKRRHNDTLTAGASLEWPLPETVARAERAVARLDQQKTDVANENVRYRLFTRLRNLSLQLEREKELIASADDRITFAEAVLNAESENYTFGRASLNDYIAAVNALDSSRLEKIAREIRLRQILLEFRRLTDVLVTKEDVNAR